MSALSGATLVPAYGRDYKSREEVEGAFEAGKDFQLASIFHGLRNYVSRKDFEPGDFVKLRYRQLTSVCVYKVKGGAL